MQNQKLCVNIMYAILLAAIVAASYLMEYALAAMSVIALMMTYFYGSSLNKILAMHERVVEAEQDEEFADNLMHAMWDNENLETKYISGLIEYFSKSTSFDFTSYYRRYTCSEVEEVKGTEWEYIKYCPYNHPGLYICVMVKDLDLFVFEEKNLRLIKEALQEWPKLKEEQDNEDDLDPADRVEELELVEEFIIKQYRKS